MKHLSLLLFKHLSLKYFTNHDHESVGYLVNISSHVMLVAKALNILHYNDLGTESYSTFNKDIDTGLSMLLDYLLYDLIKYVVFLKFRGLTNDMFFHHVGGFALFLYIRHNFLIHHVMPYLFLYEVSSIPLNLRYYLKKHSPNSNLLLPVELAFLGSFVYFRWYLSFQKLYRSIVKLYYEQQHWFDFQFLFINFVVFAILNGIWTFKMVQMVFRKLVR